MKRIRIPMIALAALLLLSSALADTISFTGTVKNADAVTVSAPIGGTVGDVPVQAGEKVTAGETLVTLQTEKVYAPADGVVTGLFGQPGDSADEIANRYGAVLYLEEESVYTISASTDNAYSATENKFVHVGEEVCLSCYTDGSHTGTGVITQIKGTDYTVRVTEGEFLIGETVNVYRGEEAVSSARIGRGTLERIDPTAVKGTGSIVSFAVTDGAVVSRGDLLFETLNGTFDGYYMSGTVLTAPVSGTLSEVSARKGGSIQKGESAAVIWPEGRMRVEASVSETDLAYIKEGDPVRIELNWNMDEEISYEGTVTWISRVAEEGSSAGTSGMGETASSSSAVKYAVWIDFTPDEETLYGMTAVVTTVDPEEEQETADEAADAEEPEEETAKRPEGFDGQFPEGFDGQFPEGFDGQLPEGFDGQFPEGFDGQFPEGFDGQLPAFGSGDE